MLFDKAEDSGSEFILLVDAGWWYSVVQCGARRQYWIVFILGSSIDQRPETPPPPHTGPAGQRWPPTMWSFSLQYDVNHFCLTGEQIDLLPRLQSNNHIFLRPLSSSPLSSATSAKEEDATSTNRDITVPRSLWGDNTFLSCIKYFPSLVTADQNTTSNQSKILYNNPLSRPIIFIWRRFQQKPRLTPYSSSSSTDTNRIHQQIRWNKTRKTLGTAIILPFLQETRRNRNIRGEKAWCYSLYWEP